MPHAPRPGSWAGPLEIAHVEGSRRVTGRLLLYLPSGYRPEGRHPLVIALHGWGSALEDWPRRSGIAGLADRLGAVLVCPDMGHTVYEDRYFKGLRPRPGRTPALPGARWIGEVVLPLARRSFGVSKEPGRTAILGYSTGGRGALLVAQRYPEFGFAAGMSGTYDLDALSPGTGEYRIHAALYGPRHRYPERWRRDQSVTPDLVARLKGVRVVLGHGALDRVVPAAQTRAMAKAITGAGLPAPILRIDPRAAHDFSYWRRELERTFGDLGKALDRTAPRRPH
ncbi:MAG: alpha/beta hydrolase-fold protein [Polyangia bacterium]|jgi:S-formylglutathione hydrolase FrmB|nr:alpha/beta hydrolase-fold protein [Polyangia bacterium]